MSLDIFVQSLAGDVGDEAIDRIRALEKGHFHVSATSFSALVDEITSEQRALTSRRWLGVLLIEVIEQDQALVELLQQECTDVPRVLGKAMLATNNEVLKLVIGRIIWLCIAKGGDVAHFWPTKQDGAIRDKFPMTKEGDWLADFQHFLGDVTPEEEPIDAVFLIVSASADGEPIEDRTGHFALIVGNMHTTMTTLSAPGLRFIDIPLHLINSTKWSQHKASAKIGASQRQAITAEVNMTMHEPQEYLVHAKRHTAEKFCITFWDIEEAQDAVREIRQKRDALPNRLEEQGEQSPPKTPSNGKETSVKYARTSTHISQGLTMVPTVERTSGARTDLTGQAMPSQGTAASVKRKMRDEMQEPPTDPREVTVKAKRQKKQAVQPTKTNPKVSTSTKKQTRQTAAKPKAKLVVKPSKLNVVSYAEADSDQDYDVVPSPPSKESRSRRKPATKSQTRKGKQVASDDYASSEASSSTHDTSKAATTASARADVPASQTRSKGEAANIELVSDTSHRKPAIVSWTSKGPKNQGTPQPVAAKSYGRPRRPTALHDSTDELAVTAPHNAVTKSSGDPNFKVPTVPNKHKGQHEKPRLSESYITREAINEEHDAWLDDENMSEPRGVHIEESIISAGLTKLRRKSQQASPLAMKHAKPDQQCQSQSLSTRPVIEKANGPSHSAAPTMNTKNEASDIVELSDNSPEPPSSSDDDGAGPTKTLSAPSVVHAPMSLSYPRLENMHIDEPVAAEVEADTGTRTQTSKALNNVETDTGSQLSKRVGELGSPYGTHTRLPLHLHRSADDQSHGLPSGNSAPKLRPSSFLANLRASNLLQDEPKQSLQPAEIVHWDEDEPTLLDVEVGEPTKIAHQKVESHQHRHVALKKVVVEEPSGAPHDHETDEAQEDPVDESSSTATSTPQSDSPSSPRPSSSPSPKAELTWTAALDHHERPLAETLTSITRALLSHVHDREVATSALLRDYATNGAQLIREVGAAHEMESAAAHVKLDEIMQIAAAKREQHARACGKIVKEIEKSRKKSDVVIKDVAPMREVKLRGLQALREKFCIPGRA